MKSKDFDLLVENRIELIRKVLSIKEGEYSDDADRFYNFKVAARINDCSTKEALWGMASKHWVSVIDLVRGKRPIDKAVVSEKIGDLVNYLLLLEGILYEELDNVNI